jgi:hypothetical protein
MPVSRRGAPRFPASHPHCNSRSSTP